MSLFERKGRASCMTKDNCCICLESHSNLISAHRKFEHFYCKECIVSWVKSNNKLDCPVCSLIIDNAAQIFDDKLELFELLWTRDDGFEIIEELLVAGFGAGYMASSLLPEAVKLGKVNVARLLLRDMKNIPIVDPSTLVEKNHMDLVEKLMTFPCRSMFGRKVLYEMAKHGKLDFDSELVKSLPSSHWYPTLAFAMEKCDFTILKYWFDRFKDDDIISSSKLFFLSVAILSGQIEVIKWIFTVYPIFPSIETLARNCTNHQHPDYTLKWPVRLPEGHCCNFLRIFGDLVNAVKLHFQSHASLVI